MLQHHCSSMSSNGWGAANPLLRGSADCPLRELCRNSSLVRILARAIFTISSGGSTPVPSTVKRNSSCSHPGEPLGQCSKATEQHCLATVAARMHSTIEQHWLLVRGEPVMPSAPCCSCCMCWHSRAVPASALTPKHQPAAQGGHDRAKAAISAAKEASEVGSGHLFRTTANDTTAHYSQAACAAPQLKTRRHMTAFVAALELCAALGCIWQDLVSPTGRLLPVPRKSQLTVLWQTH